MAMGKSIELLGLVTANVFVAMALSAAFLAGDHKDTALRHLSQTHIENFIQETTAISSGQRPDMDSFAITTYFMDHVADEGKFRTTVRYNIPDAPEEERAMEMGKMDFISNIIEGQKTLNRHEAKIVIDHIKIEPDGRKAFVVTTNYERGVMPVADSFGGTSMMPVTGTSWCEQILVLNDKRVIQMSGASCTTDIAFAEGY